MLSKLQCHDHLLGFGRIGRHGEGIVEPRPELPVGEQVHAQQRHQNRRGATPARLQLHQSQHQHRNQGGPHLGLRHRHVVNLAGRDHREARQVPVVIEPQVPLDSSLGGAKLRPVVHRKAQVSQRGVQAHQFVREAELLDLPASELRQLGLTARIEQVKHTPVQLPRPMPAQVRELALAAA